MAYQAKDTTRPATHEGAHGDHPVGGAVGAAAGGILGGAAVGAAKGAMAGSLTANPLGTITGAAVGGVVGALAGKGIAQQINPTTEDEYWRENHKSRPYVVSGEPYDTYRPAYRHGIEAYDKYEGREFDEVEPQLRQDWERRQAALPWDRARPAARDAYDRLRNRTITSDQP